jgi:hypothetical protein
MQLTYLQGRALERGARPYLHPPLGRPEPSPAYRRAHDAADRRGRPRGGPRDLRPRRPRPGAYPCKRRGAAVGRRVQSPHILQLSGIGDPDVAEPARDQGWCTRLRAWARTLQTTWTSACRGELPKADHALFACAGC